MQAVHDNIVARYGIFNQMKLLMAKAGQIDKKYLEDENASLLLFYAMNGFLCHVGIEEDLTKNQFLLPTGYFRLMGNGALDEMMKYWRIIQDRGEIRKWKIVT